MTPRAHFLIPALIITALILCSTQHLNAAPTAASPVARIKTAVAESQRVPLNESPHPLARPEFDKGRVPAETRLNRMLLMLSASEEQDQALRRFIIEQHDRTSPNFQKWLAPEEFGNRFGVAQKDIDSLTAWLQKHGLKVERVSVGRRAIEISGTAAQVFEAFQAEIHQFEINGRKRFANISAPTIPAALSPVVKGFVSLHSFPRRSLVHARKVTPQASNGLIKPQFNPGDGSHVLTPHDFATIYNIKPLWLAGIDGTGQSIAVVGRTRTWGNFWQFSSYTGIPEIDLVDIRVNDEDPGIPSEADEVESSTDIEWAAAVANRARIYFVIGKSTQTTDGIDLASQYAVDHNVAPIITVSYGTCETQNPSAAQFYKELWQQAAAQGISVVVAAGDNGSAGCDDFTLNAKAKYGFAVNALASTPDNVAVGGSSLNDSSNPGFYWAASNDENHASALKYIPEITWNDSSATGTVSILAGSGGVSSIHSTPVWQSGSGVPTIDPNGTGHHRYLPDLAMNSGRHVPYFVCALSMCSYVDNNGTPNYFEVYGTSVTAPAFAGMMALVNQYTGTRQGNPNFRLYPLAKTPGIFHDVTSGTNSVPCSAGLGCSGGKMAGYNAGAGFDLATGWGSVDVEALVKNWNSVSFLSTTLTGTVSSTNFQHGTAVNLSATLKPTSGSGSPKGAVSAYVVNNGATTTLGTATVSSGLLFAPTKEIPGGSGTVYFRYGGDGVYGGSVTLGTAVTVTPEPSVMTFTNLPLNLQGGQTFSIQFSMAGSSGVGTPTGSVEVFRSGTKVGSGTVYHGIGGAIVDYINPGAGTYTFTAVYSGDASFQTVAKDFQVTYGKYESVPTGSACSNGVKDVVLAYPITCTLTMGAVGRTPPIGLPTGNVQFYDNGNKLGDPVALVDAKASLTLSTLPVERHNLAAVYLGDNNYLERTEGLADFNVVPTGTINARIYSTTPSAKPGVSFPIFIYATADQYGPALTGTATLKDGSTVLGTWHPGSNPAQLEGDINLNTAANPWTMGNHPLTLTYTGDPKWPNSESAVSNVLISNPGFTIDPIPTVTLKQGGEYFTYLNLRSISGFYGNVSLTCSGAPEKSTCEIPESAWVGSTPSITIKTTAPRYAGVFGTPIPLRSWIIALAMGCVALGVFAPHSRRRGTLILVLGFLITGITVSCGGGGGSPNQPPGPPPPVVVDAGTPTGTYTLTITATTGSGSEAVTHSYPVELVVTK